MSEHVEELLELRKSEHDTPEARSWGEWNYRRQVMRLIGATPVPGLDPPSVVRKLRRIEGTVTVRTSDDSVPGLVMFAEGNDGRGAAADVRSKEGMPAARSLLVAYPLAEFILVITTAPPSPAMLALADAKSELFYLGKSMQRRIWVMGLSDLVARSEAFLVAREAYEREPRPWWRFWEPKSADDVPASPLLVDMR